MTKQEEAAMDAVIMEGAEAPKTITVAGVAFAYHATWPSGRVDYQAKVLGRTATLMQCNDGRWVVILHGRNVSPAAYGATPEEAAADLPAAIVRALGELEAYSMELAKLVGEVK